MSDRRFAIINARIFSGTTVVHDVWWLGERLDLVSGDLV